MRGGGAWLTLDQAHELAAELQSTLHQRDRLSLKAAALAAELDASRYGESEGSISTIDWIRHECKLGGGAAADLVCVGRQLEAMKSSVRAVDKGEVGYAHLVVLARTREALSRADALPEEHLLEQARQVSVGKLWHLCEHARHAAEAAAMDEEAGSAVEARALRLRRTQDGLVGVNGVLDPLGAATLRTALAPLARKAGPEDERKSDRRLADALIELAGHQLDSAPVRQRPHLQVTATLGTLYRIPNSPGAELEDCGVVSRETVNRIACDCSISRYLFESESILVDAGRERRTVAPATRRALEKRDRHCRWPGCERKASWCEAHHVVHWIDGGPTDADNLVLLCNRHHFLVHEGRWKLLLHPDGHLQVVRPPLDFLVPPALAG